MKTIFITIIMMLLPMLVSADPVEVDGLNYLLNEEEKTATVTSSNYDGILVIPETIKVDKENYIVTAIGKNAFIRNNSLLSVSIPNTVKTIYDYAFYECSGLASVKIGDGVEFIGDFAFYRCGIVSITIGNNLKTVGSSAFNGDYSLTQVYIKDLTAWCDITFNGVTSNPLYYSHHLYLDKKEVVDLVIPESVKKVKSYAFAGANNIKSLKISRETTSICALAFYQCTSLNSVNLGNSLTSIESQAFSECTSIETVDVPDEVSFIGVEAFNGCSKLENLKLSEKLKIIKNDAFKGCGNLENITIPEQVEFIYQNVFLNTKSNLSLIMKSEYPPIAYSPGFPEGTKLIVPDGSIELYQSVEPWKNLKILSFSESGPEKCATPTISYLHGVLSFKSETPEVEFHYSISSADGQKAKGSSINISGNCLVSVYASKSGYENSDTVTQEVNIIGKLGDVNRDGTVNVADVVDLTNIIMTPAE